jgi:tetratricopeptide (TPR) repeat protein
MAIVAFGAAFAVTQPSVHAAGLFGGGNKSAATPTPSPTASALPTASPEPPSVAIPRLQAKLQANPNDQEAMTQLAGQYLAIGHPEASVKLTQHLLQMGDKSAQVYYLDAYSMQNLGHIDIAISDLEQARNLDPSNASVLQQLTALYLRANRFSEAEHIANSAIVLNKGDADSLMLLGDVYATEQKYDDARTQFNLAAAKDPKDAQPYVQIAQTYSQQNNIPMALQYVAKALALDPKDIATLTFKGDLYAHQHDDANAMAAYDDAIVAAPTDDQKVQIVITKATYFVSEKKNSQAESIFLQGIAQYPKVAGIYVAYGEYLLQQKNVDKAKAEFQQALSVDADNPEALLRLGELAMSQQKFTDAIGYLKHLTQVQPDPRTFALLGQAYSFQRDFVDQKDACSKSFELDRRPETLGCIAGADFQLKNYKEAAQIFDVLDNNAKGFLDQNPPLLFLAAKVYAETQQKDKAIGAYRRLLAEMKKGTKDYSNIQNLIADLQKPAPKKKP